jgi:hypothetical protein
VPKIVKMRLSFQALLKLLCPVANILSDAVPGVSVVAESLTSCIVKWTYYIPRRSALSFAIKSIRFLAVSTPLIDSLSPVLSEITTY